MSAPTKQTTTRRTAAPKANSRVTQYVDQQLERTRRQVKSTDLIAAGLLLVVMVIGFLLLAAIVDAWVITLTPIMRWSALLLLVAGCVCMMAFSIWPLLTKQINPDYAAKMLEESKPGFRNSVLNYVWFRKKPDDIRSAVFDAVARQAAVDLNSVPADSSVDRSKVIRLGFWLVGMTAAFIVYFMLSPKNPFQTLNRVMFPAADLAKPAVVTISDVTPGNASVFFGDQVEITAKVYGQHSPEDVQLIFSTNDGRQMGQTMLMQPDPTTPRQYKLDLTKNTGGVRESLEYEIVARDGQSGKYEIKVAPRPAITIESIQIKPPKYTKLKSQTILHGAIDGVEGAMVIVDATANLEIESATIELLRQQPTAPNQDQKFKMVQAPLGMKVESKSARRTFQLTLDSNRAKPMATHYRLNFRSVTGKSPEAPNVYPIRIIPDLAPELEVRRPTAPESKVAANGRLSVVAIANDLDYEISYVQITVERRGNEILSKKLPLKVQTENGQKAQARFEIKPEELGLSVGDQAIFYLTAGDNRTTYFNDDPAPNVTRSNNYSFTVTQPNKSPDRQANPPKQDQPSSDSNPGDEPQQSDEKSEGGEDGDASSKDESTANDSSDSNDGDEGESQGGSETGEDGGTSEPERGSQPNDNDPSQSPEGSPDDQPEAGSEGTDDSKSSDTDSSESQEADGQQGNDDSESASEDSGSGTSEQPSQDSPSQGKGGSESGPDGAEPENKSQGGGGDTQPSDSDPNADASDARQGNNPTGNDVSDTAPESRDENLTDGDEQLSKDASEAEKVRQLEKLMSENPEMREQSASSEQADTDQQRGSQDPSDEDSSNPESAQPEKNSDGSDNAGDESEQPQESGNQANSDQPKQNQDGSERSPNTEDSNPRDSESQSAENSQDNESSNSKSPSEGSPEQSEGSPQNEPQPKQSNNQQEPAESSEPSGQSESGEPSSGEPSSGEPSSGEPGSGEPSDSNSKSPSDSESSESGQPGDESAKQQGPPSESGQPGESSSPSEQSDQPSDQPSEGSPSGESSNASKGSNKPGESPNESKPGEQPENMGDRTGGKGAEGTEALQREKENLEYSQKKIDLLLDDLRNQRENPNEELLKKMNWNKQDLNDFIDSHDEMRAAAEQGDVRAKREYDRRLKSYGLRPDAKRRAVAGNEEEAGVLNQSGVVNEAPPEENHNFNLFLQDLQRARP